MPYSKIDTKKNPAPPAGQSAGQADQLRKTGLNILAKLSWGTHFCQFYKTKRDLLDILVPYFKAGLESNELCVWVTSEFLTAKEALDAMAKAVPNFSRYLAKRQIEIFPYTEWYLKEGRFDMRRVLKQWVNKYDQGIKAGFEGARVSGNPFWISNKKEWDDFSEYEAEINNVVGRYKLLVLCTYSLDKCDADEILDVVNNHEFAIIKRRGNWSLIESKANVKTKKALQKSEQRYHSLFSRMTESFALCELVYDRKSVPCDYRFIDVNPAFEKFTGLARNNIVGHLRSEIPIPLSPASFAAYAKTALTGNAARFDNYNKTLGKHYHVRVYSMSRGQFATIFTDITERKRAEETAKKEKANLQTIFDAANVGMMLIDEKGNVEKVNNMISRWSGKDKKGQPGDFLGCVHALEQPLGCGHSAHCRKCRIRKSFEAALREKKPYHNIEAKSSILADGEEKRLNLEISADPLEINGRQCAILTIKDVTESKKRQESLKSLNRTLEALNGVNHAILRAKNEKELLEDVCKTIVRDCGHKMVWIGYANNDERKSIETMAWAGFEKGYVNTLNLTWANRERGRGPTGTAIRTGTPQRCKNMLVDPQIAPWRKEALKRGYASSIAVPLTTDGKTIGAITIYSKETDPFTDDEVGLLTQLANDTAFGISTLRLRKDLDKTARDLRETSEYLDNLLTYANAPIIVWDPSFKITKFNRAFENLTGLKASRVIGKPLEILFPEQSKIKSMALIKSALAGKNWETVEIPILREDGSTRVVVWNSANIKGGGEKIVATIAQGQDITEQKKAEKERNDAMRELAKEQLALKQHTLNLEQITIDLKKFQLAVESASDVIVITDRSGTILFANQALERIVGYKPAEVIGKQPFFWKGNMPAEFYSKLWRAIKTNQKPFSGEVINTKKSGGKVITQLDAAPILDSNGKAMFFIGIGHDITEAKEIDRAKTEFISLAAHQLRTPLSTISLSTEMLIAGAVGSVDDNVKTLLRDTFDSAHKMASLIELFLNVSRIELGRLEIDPQPMDSVSLAREIVREMNPQAAAKRLSLKVDFPDNLPIIKVDRKIMHMAIENLLSNACKYTPERGSISFSIRTTKDSMEYAVSDTGCGIPKAQLPHIFTKMFRASNAENIDGLGLGLYITKNTIEESGGKMSVATDEGKGSTFTISIPLSGMKKKKIRL